MFKHTLLALALLVPMALIAKSPVTKEVPFPECFPCDPKTGSLQTVAAVKEVPFPECFPCDPKTGSLQTVAAVKEVPFPECFPCDPKTGS